MLEWLAVRVRIIINNIYLGSIVILFSETLVRPISFKLVMLFELLLLTLFEVYESSYLGLNFPPVILGILAGGKPMTWKHPSTLWFVFSHFVHFIFFLLLVLNMLEARRLCLTLLLSFILFDEGIHMIYIW